MSNRIGPLFLLRLRHLPAARALSNRLLSNRLLSAGLLAATLPLALAACAGPRTADEMPSSAESSSSASNSSESSPTEQGTSPPAPGAQPIAVGEPHPMPAPRSCNADAAKAAAIGQTADAATVERVRVQAGGHTVRVLKPGQAITKEYLDGRVNVHVDANNVIVEVGCG